jgi:regulator of protease activity HflC (stomatin/prohibitin superfamily)
VSFFEILLAIWDRVKWFAIVESWEQGVRFRRGVPEPEPLGAGIWFHWPTLDRIQIDSVQQQYLDLPMQSVTTKDGATVSFSANVCFSISNLVLAYCEVHDLTDFMTRAAMGHLHGKIHGWSYDELMAELKELEQSLESTLQTKTKKFGVKIVDVKLTDMAKTRLYRLL